MSLVLKPHGLACCQPLAPVSSMSLVPCHVLGTVARR